MSFFTTTFMSTEYNSSLSQSAQGQLSSSYTAAITAELQSEAVADYIAFLAFQGGATVDEALALKADIVSGSFSLSGLFGAAQSKTGPVDGGSVTDPAPTLTAGSYTLDLTAILGGLDAETWTVSNTNGSGKKATTETNYHTREFYTETHEPSGYNANWAAPPPPEEEYVPTLHTASATWTVIKGDAIPDFGNIALEAGTDYKITNLVVSGTGDYDWDVEGFSVTGDATGSFSGLNGSNATGNSSPEKLLNVSTGPIPLNTSGANLADGFDYSVTFTSPTQNGSSVTFSLDYSYMA